MGCDLANFTDPSGMQVNGAQPAFTPPNGRTSNSGQMYVEPDGPGIMGIPGLTGGDYSDLGSAAYTPDGSINFQAFLHPLSLNTANAHYQFIDGHSSIVYNWTQTGASYWYGDVEHGLFKVTDRVFHSVEVSNDGSNEKANRRAETADKIGTVAGYAGTAADITKEAAEGAKLVGIAKASTITGYTAMGVGTAADLYLSTQKNPETGKPYQSWNMTLMNGIVAGTAYFVGGVPGIFIESGYSLTKLNQANLEAHPEFNDGGMWMQ